MPLESATYLSELDSSNPPSTDPTGQGDDHLRLVKAALQATFPNFTAAPLNSTQAQLDAVVAAVAVPTGAMMPFAGTTSDTNWLRCNGATFAYATYPELGAFLGYSSGTCTLPNLEDTGRFVRSIKSGIAVRDTQSSQNKSHTHTGSLDDGSLSVTGTVSGTTGDDNVGHTHDFGGTSDGQSVDHHHTFGTSGSSTAGGGNGVPNGADTGSPTRNTSGTSNDHTHTFGGTTDNPNSAHTHDFSWTGTLNGALGNTDFTTASSGSSEARPEAYVAIWYIHI